MTTLEKALSQRGISVYRLTQLLGKNPMQMHGHIAKKVRGEGTMTMDELKEICYIISNESKQPLKVSDIEINIVHLTVK